MQFDKQSSKDLEFDVVCELLSSYCKSQKAKENALRISFFENPEKLQLELDLLKEIMVVHEDERLTFPHPNAEDIDNALNILRIENGVLILSELIKVYSLCIGTRQLIRFAHAHRTELPLVFEACEHITGITDILKIITSILDEKQLAIKDNATPSLAEIRSRQKSNKIAINKNFERALRHYKQDDFLADSEETFLENRRLLSVLSQYKRRVNGRIFGSSAKGNYTYIEPAENAQLNAAQEQLRIDESNELFAILEQVTFALRAEKKQLKAFQRLLVKFDLLNAKVLFGLSYQGIIPKVNNAKNMDWQNARHPLLFLKNQAGGDTTIGQDIALKPTNRILVISGPNAGGKSITLKTVGLTQMMCQSGLLLAIDPQSTCGWFDQILSDIGDNQSIENQLSTYSYRLNRMRFFLDNADGNTLLLLDEFGSGSDPELGGALAEVFFEELYDRMSFAVITTHYTNIKILTAEKDAATNACMLFDTKKLTPLYQLSIGQPGSSFTFEVAQYNGIPVDIIERAKEKVSEAKVNVDKLSASLQKEKSKFRKINDEQYKSNFKAKKAVVEYEKKISQTQ
jgi:DNA mismatch repair protein MutS2